MKRILLSAALVAVCLAALVGVSPARAQSGNTWRIDYFNNPNWAGSPVTTQWNSLIAFNWGFGSPSPAVPVDNFTGAHDHRRVLLRGDLSVLGRGRRRGRADHRRRDPPRHPRAGSVGQVVHPEHPDVAGHAPRRSALSRVHADGVRLRELGAAWERWRHPGATGGSLTRRCRPRPARCRRSSATTRPASSRTSTRRTASSRTAPGIRRTWVRSRWNRRSRVGTSARPNTISTFLNANSEPQEFACSRTLAGWFRAKRTGYDHVRDGPVVSRVGFLQALPLSIWYARR